MGVRSVKHSTATSGDVLRPQYSKRGQDLVLHSSDGSYSDFNQFSGRAQDRTNAVAPMDYSLREFCQLMFIADAQGTVCKHATCGQRVTEHVS